MNHESDFYLQNLSTSLPQYSSTPAKSLRQGDESDRVEEMEEEEEGVIEEEDEKEKKPHVLSHAFWT